MQHYGRSVHCRRQSGWPNSEPTKRLTLAELFPKAFQAGDPTVRVLSASGKAPVLNGVLKGNRANLRSDVAERLLSRLCRIRKESSNWPRRRACQRSVRLADRSVLRLAATAALVRTGNRPQETTGARAGGKPATGSAGKLGLRSSIVRPLSSCCWKLPPALSALSEPVASLTIIRSGGSRPILEI